MLITNAHNSGSTIFEQLQGTKLLNLRTDPSAIGKYHKLQKKTLNVRKGIITQTKHHQLRREYLDIKQHRKYIQLTSPSPQNSTTCQATAMDSKQYASLLADINILQPLLEKERQK